MINEFISQVKTLGLARTNRFVVNIPFSYADSEAARAAILFCDSVTLPSVSVATTPNRIWGEAREMPYEKNYDTVNFSFYVDSNMVVKRIFDDWMNRIQHPTTKVMNYYKNYIEDITISVIDMETDMEVYSVTLYEAYPKVVGSIQMDSASKDVMKLNVTMNYKYFTTSEYAIDSSYYNPQNTSSTYYENTSNENVTTGQGFSTTAMPNSEFPSLPFQIPSMPKIVPRSLSAKVGSAITMVTKASKIASKVKRFI